MKSLIHFVAAFGVVSMLAGCRDEPPSAPPTRAVPPPSASRPVPPSPDVVARSVADLEKRVEVERQLRLGTETRLTEQETAKSRWQVATWVAVSAAEILLIVGAILGTRARHDAKK